MKKNLLGTAMWAAMLTLVSSCGNQPAANGTYPKIKSARSLSEHYVLVEFEEPAGAVAADPSRYLIVDPKLQQLSVESASLSVDGLEATLATASSNAARASSTFPPRFVGRSSVTGMLPRPRSTTSSPPIASRVSNKKPAPRPLSIIRTSRRCSTSAATE